MLTDSTTLKRRKRANDGRKVDIEQRRSTEVDLKIASVNVDDVYSSNSSNSSHSQDEGGISRILASHSILELSSEYPMSAFPSLDLENLQKSETRNSVSLQLDLGSTINPTQTTDLILSSGQITKKVKLKCKSTEPKRPVGRPRLYEKKIVIRDPNKPKRGEFA